MAASEAMNQDQRVLARARTLSADATTIEVVTALRQADVPVVLLKGVTVADWLYPDEGRVYMDVDLLVPPDRAPAAEKMLAELGFDPIDEGLERPPHGLVHSQPWVRPSDLANVDLHRSLFGVGVAPDKVWEEVARAPGKMSVGGLRVDVLAPAARTLHLALHAAQHDHSIKKPLEDLGRAVERLPAELWAEAAALAERLDASPTFVLGLARLPEGLALASRLEVVRLEVARAATDKRSAARLAVGFDRLARTSGVRARVGIVAREVVPSRSFIRYWSPLARRGRAGMVAAYLWRPIWLLLHTAPSIAAFRRHRRP